MYFERFDFTLPRTIFRNLCRSFSIFWPTGGPRGGLWGVPLPNITRPADARTRRIDARGKANRRTRTRLTGLRLDSQPRPIGRGTPERSSLVRTTRRGADGWGCPEPRL